MVRSGLSVGTVTAMSQASAGWGRLIRSVSLGALCLALCLLWVAPGSAAAAGGSISGTITAAAGGLPIEDAVACAYEPWTEGFCDEADAAGHYSITGIPPGTYVVSFQKYESNLLIQYFDHTDEYWDGEQIVVTEGSSRSGVDAALEEGGTISGTVTEAAGGEPIAHLEVCVQRTNSGSTTCEETGEDGTYTFEKLYPGEYKVHFLGGEAQTGEPPNYVPEYFDDKPAWVGSDSVSIGAGTVASGIDADLEEGSEVAGSVTYVDSGEPAEQVQVCLYRAVKGTEVRCRRTDEEGEYAMVGVPAGEYKVGFFPEWGSPYARQLYDEATSLATADPVTLTTGVRTSGIDAALIEAGKLSGTVTAAAGGAPIQGVSVCAFEENESFGATCDQTDAGGEYAIEGLEAGEYVVQFHGGFDYLGQYFEGTTSFAEAERVEVENGATRSGVDAQMSAAGRIEGEVTEADGGGPLSGAEVCAVPSTASSFFQGTCATTNGAGGYVIGGLVAGDYDVRFTRIPKGPGPRYLTQYFDGAPTRALADPVAVTTGATSDEVDAAMQLGGQITGTVRDALTNAGIEASICALPVNRSGEGQCAQADADGDYAIFGLQTGAYKVRFSAGFSGDAMNYLRSFWDGTPNRSEAEPVAVTAEEITPGIDGALERGGMITGTVTSAGDEAPIVGARVCATNWNTCTYSGSDGIYALQGLPAGSFEIYFEGPGFDSPYAPAYYEDAATAATASAIAVSPGQIKAGIDQELQEAGRISGTVVDATTDEPLEDISVCAYSPAAEWSRCRYTDEDGTYLLQGVPPGAYQVHFDHSDNYPPDSNAKYVPQYYEDSLTLAGATLVGVAGGELTAGVDAGMHVGGTIDGQVTLASSSAPYPGVGVCLLPASGEEELHDCTFTDTKGEYTLAGIADGDYTVEFYPGLYAPVTPPNLMRQYYDGAETQAGADTVTIAGGSAAHGIDAALLAGAEIRGVVTDAADGSPIEGAWVCAYGSGGEEPAGCAGSNAHGEYTISRLPTGSYEVEFSVLGYEGEGFFELNEESSGTYEEFLTQFYDGAGSAAEADPVAVVAGEGVDGIDAAMVAGGPPPWEKPALRLAPQLSGSPVAGESLSCTEGSWRHGPTDYSFRWLRDGSPVALPDLSTYTLQAGDAGHGIACEVTASNDSGSTKAISNVVEVSGASGGGQPPVASPAAGTAPVTKPRLKCRKGFRKKLVHGKRRCVKVHHHHKRHHKRS